MERLHNVLSKIGFHKGGSSDEDVVVNKLRSNVNQATPRMSRSRHNTQHHQLQQNLEHGSNLQQARPFGSMGNMEVNRVNRRIRERSWESERMHRIDQAPTLTREQAEALNRSWDIDKVPGLDRNWQAEQTRGLQLVQRSMEKEKERRLHLVHTQTHAHRQQHDMKKKKKKKDKTKDSQTMMEQIDNNKLSQERLERRIDELNRMLMEEKHQNRRDKLAVAKLQQEVARQKSDKSIHQLKELEHERMLRLEAEKRLRNANLQNNNNKAQLQAVQEDFKKMEQVTRTMLQYKNKVEQLKHEKATLSINYEKNVQKLKTESGNLENENKILSAELKRLETQCNNCEHCNSDLSYRVSKMEPGQMATSDKVKMLLERLKHLEEEKSQLVLENENQRQQYDKCLDEISNRVVQALLSQKGLREECNKLRQRVVDLEEQNKQLKDMFQHRGKFASDSLLQMDFRKKINTHSKENLEQNNLRVKDLTTSSNSISPLSQISLGSLQSICSNYQESNGGSWIAGGQPEPSSPPQWLKDQMKTDSSNGSCSTLDPTLTDSSPKKPASALYPQNILTDRKTHNKHDEGGYSSNHICHSKAYSAFHPVIPIISTQGVNKSSIAFGSNQQLSDSHPEIMNAHTKCAMTTTPEISVKQQEMPLTKTMALSPHLAVAEIKTSATNTTKSYDHLNFDVNSQLMNEADLNLISSIKSAKKRFSKNIDYEMETEYPANCSSPKVKHNERTSSQVLTPALHKREIYGARSSEEINEEADRNNVSPGTQMLNMSYKKFTLTDDVYDQQIEKDKNTPVRTADSKISKSSAFVTKVQCNETDTFMDSENDSDDSDESQPLSNQMSMASTMSLNDILDTDHRLFIPSYNQDGISLDGFNIFRSDDEDDIKDPMDRFKLNISKVSGSVDNSKTTTNCDNTISSQTQTHSDKEVIKSVNNQKKKEEDKTDYGDYVCLSKIREYIYMNMPEIKKNEESTLNSTCVKKQTGVDASRYDNAAGECSQDSLELDYDQVFHSSEHLQDSCRSRSVSCDSTSSLKHAGDLQLVGSSNVYQNKPNTLDFKQNNQNSIDNQNVLKKRLFDEETELALKSCHHDYVNLSPEMIQEILIRGNPQHLSNKITNGIKEGTSQKYKNSKTTNENLSTSHWCNTPTKRQNNVKAISSSEDTNTLLDSSHCSWPAASADNGIKHVGIGSPSTNMYKQAPEQRDQICIGSPDSGLHTTNTSIPSSDCTCSEQENEDFSPLKNNTINSSSNISKDEGYSSNSANSVKTDSGAELSQQNKKIVDGEKCNNSVESKYNYSHQTNYYQHSLEPSNGESFDNSCMPYQQQEKTALLRSVPKIFSIHQRAESTSRQLPIENYNIKSCFIHHILRRCHSVTCVFYMKRHTPQQKILCAKTSKSLLNVFKKPDVVIPLKSFSSAKKT